MACSRIKQLRLRHNRGGGLYRVIDKTRMDKHKVVRPGTELPPRHVATMELVLDGVASKYISVATMGGA